MSASARDEGGGRFVGFSRRSVLSLGATGLVIGLTGCSLDRSESPDAPTQTAEPSPTAELPPTPPQPPIASPVPGYSDPTRWAGRTLNIAAWGGDYQDAQHDAFFAAFRDSAGRFGLAVNFRERSVDAAPRDFGAYFIVANANLR